MSDELTRTEQWLYATLTADTALAAVVAARVYSEAAPAGSTFPLVVFSLEYASDVTTAFHNRIMVAGLWRIRGITTAESYDTNLQTIADRIDVLLDRSNGGTADSAVIFTSVREEPYKRLTVDEGIQYRQLGGIFRVFSQRP